jgi:hypothetical protein
VETGRDVDDGIALKKMHVIPLWNREVPYLEAHTGF